MTELKSIKISLALIESLTLLFIILMVFTVINAIVDYMNPSIEEWISIYLRFLVIIFLINLGEIIVIYKKAELFSKKRWGLIAFLSYSKILITIFFLVIFINLNVSIDINWSFGFNLYIIVFILLNSLVLIGSLSKYFRE